MESEKNEYLGALTDQIILSHINSVGNALERVSEDVLLTCDLFWWMSQVLDRGYDRHVTIQMFHILESNHKIVSH